MRIITDKIELTNDSITNQAGLMAPLQLMQSLGFSNIANQCLPQPASNRGFAPALYLQTLMLMLHSGGECLEDVRSLREDQTLVDILDIKQFPAARSLGEWLVRTGNQPQAMQALTPMNRLLISSALHRCQSVTLDIDATEIVAHKKGAKWTYNGNKGFMPIVGHIAETDQVVAYDFREGNVSPNKDNLAFIQKCEKALPAGCHVKAVRIDAAGYQQSIIEYCDAHGIAYAIRATMIKSIRRWASQRDDDEWEVMYDKHGQPTGQSVICTTHCIGDYDKPFKLIIQRQPKSPQAELDLGTSDSQDRAEYVHSGYIYRAISSNREGSAQEIIDWYNQRGDASENRIKELKLDFGGDRLPCSDFKANALYFGICTLAYNLFALMRQLAPQQLGMRRIKSVRFRIYQMAGKLIKTGRKLILKVKAQSISRINELLRIFQQVRPPPKPA